MAKARPDAILYPTMGSGATISERYDHHIPLAEAGTIRMGVLDPGSVNLAATANDGTPPETGYAYVNTPADIHHMMGVCRDQGLGPSFAIYEPGFLRTVLAYHHAGVLPAGSLTKFYFSGSGYFGGGLPLYSAPPIPEALDLYLAMLGDTGLPWAVTMLGGSLLDTPVARMAIERGGHLRVGLEDYSSGPRTSSRSNGPSPCAMRSVERSPPANRLPGSSNCRGSRSDVQATALMWRRRAISASSIPNWASTVSVSAPA